MSDIIEQTVPATDEPKVKRTRTKRESVTVTDIARKRAKARGISEDKAAKEVRGILRANFDVVTKLDPSIVKVKERANDGNRWPAMRVDVDKFVNDRSYRAATIAKYGKRTK
jgi:hypothetical protein